MTPRTKAFSEVLEAEHADIWTALKGWQRFAADLEIELADCQAKAELLAKDAARMEWIEDNCVTEWIGNNEMTVSFKVMDSECIPEAIDSAIAQQEGKSNVHD